MASFGRARTRRTNSVARPFAALFVLSIPCLLLFYLVPGKETRPA